jgi:sugar lactone lactonase YvrE
MSQRRSVDLLTQIENQKVLIETYQEGLANAENPESRQFLKQKLSRSILDLTQLEGQVNGSLRRQSSPNPMSPVASPESLQSAQSLNRPSPILRQSSLDPGRSFAYQDREQGYGDWTAYNQRYSKPEKQRSRHCTLRNFLILIFILILLTVAIVLGVHFGVNRGFNYVSNSRVSVYTGNGNRDSVDGQNGTSSFAEPFGLAMDINRNLYVAEPSSGRLRRVQSNLFAITIAGTGANTNGNFPNPNPNFPNPNPNIPNPNVPQPGFPGPLPTNQVFNQISGVALDSTGSVLVCDSGNNLIRRVTFAGQVTTLAGNGQASAIDGQVLSSSFNQPSGIAFDFFTGNILVAELGSHSIRRINLNSNFVNTIAGNGRSGYDDGQGSSATFNAPTSVVADRQGNIYVVDRNNHAIRKITITGAVTTLAGGTEGFNDGTGRNAQFRFPTGITIDPRGTLYVTDSGNNLVRRVGIDGSVSTVAGNRAGFSDGVGNQAQFDNPTGIVFGSDGALYVADQRNNRVRKIDL